MLSHASLFPPFSPDTRPVSHNAIFPSNILTCLRNARKRMSFMQFLLGNRLMERYSSWRAISRVTTALVSPFYHRAMSRSCLTLLTNITSHLVNIKANSSPSIASVFAHSLYTSCSVCCFRDGPPLIHALDHCSFVYQVRDGVAI